MAQTDTVAAGKRKPSAAPRGPRFKKPLPSLTNEQVALIEALSTMTAKAQRSKLLTPQQVAPMIVRGAKTMEGDRGKQRKILKAEQPMDLTSPVSLPYVPATADEKEVRYVASDVMDYIKRVYGTVDRSFLKRARSDDPKMRGFQSWMSLGSPTDAWTFCMQPDGRPLDLAEALATDRLTDDTVILTLHEFASTLSKASRRLEVKADRTEIAKNTPKPKEPPKDRKDRWTKTGGPI